MFEGGLRFLAEHAVAGHHEGSIVAASIKARVEMLALLFAFDVSQYFRRFAAPVRSCIDIDNIHTMTLQRTLEPDTAIFCARLQ